MVKCESCGYENMLNAKFCKGCGNPLDSNGSNINETIENEHSVSKNKFNRTPATGIIGETNIPGNNGNNYANYSRFYHKGSVLAFFLSFFFLSLGQFYNGQILKGIIFVLVIFVLFSYVPFPFSLILGFLMVVYSAIDAYLNAKAITKNNGNYFYTVENGSA